MGSGIIEAPQRHAVFVSPAFRGNALVLVARAVGHAEAVIDGAAILAMKKPPAAIAARTVATERKPFDAPVRSGVEQMVADGARRRGKPRAAVPRHGIP